MYDWYWHVCFTYYSLNAISGLSHIDLVHMTSYKPLMWDDSHFVLVINPLSANVTLWRPVIVYFNITSTERVKLGVLISWVKGITEWITEVESLSDGWVADGWSARDEQPTSLPPHPSLHQETTGTQRANHQSFPDEKMVGVVDG
jgi:hypothetical protein